tara:strand:- start:3244 stop:3459 length:216 start_codon:yes stop_codon:yes gene_type:complete
MTQTQKRFQVQSTHNQVLTDAEGNDLRDQFGELVIGKAVYFEGTLEECQRFRPSFPPMASYKSRSTTIREV